jgi:hypothetical protein
MAASRRRSYDIMVLSWNTQSIKLAETLDNEVAEQHRSMITIPGFDTKLSTWIYRCKMPDFFETWVDKIKETDPDIIIVGFQEDRYPGSYFHSHLLPVEMPKLGYALLKRTKLMGVGATSVKGLQGGDPFVRGIRISVYVKDALYGVIYAAEKELRLAIANDGQDEYVCPPIAIRNKGTTASYICLPGYGRIAILCCHLPFHADNILEQRTHQNDMLRQTELNLINNYFNESINLLVTKRNPVPAHVIFFGDFNYRVAYPGNASTIASLLSENPTEDDLNNLYIKYDELYAQRAKENIYHFNEGIDNKGPVFLPTCKLDSERKYRTGKQDHRIPSWCDRILYKDFVQEDGHHLSCLYYDRFDVGETMALSDHAGVLAIFRLE